MAKKQKISELSETLWNRSGAETADQFADWILENKPSWSKSTWYIYRQSTLLKLATLEGSRRAEARLRLSQAPSRKPSKRVKRFRQPDLERVLLYLDRFSRSVYARHLSLWLRAGLLTGIRPGEWKACQVNGDFLEVTSEKFTSWCGLSKYRVLSLKEMTLEQCGIISSMTNVGSNWHAKGCFDAFMGSCAQLLHDVCKRLKLPPYTLYSVRHQAVSNMKSGGLSVSEISAVCGHKTTKGASGYGRKVSGWMTDTLIRADSNDIERVLVRHKDLLRELVNQKQEYDVMKLIM
jgi:hypothetical protein